MAEIIEPRLYLSPTMLAQRIESFVERMLGQKSPETVGTYRRALNEFARWFAGGDVPFGFTKKDVLAYREYLAQERRLSPASVSTYLTALRQLCAHLVSTGELHENPAKDVRGNARPVTHSREALTEAEVEQLFDAAEGDSPIDLRDRAMMALMIYAGLSEIELVRANYGDLDHQLLGLFLKVRGKGRTEKDQQVQLEDAAAAFLEDYLAAVRAASAPESPLFASHGHRSEGSRLTTRAVRGRINGHLKAADIKRPGISPHSLTHTAALLWLQKGATLSEVRDRMRHGTLQTTMISMRKREAQRST